MAQHNPDASMKHADPYKEVNLDTDVSPEQKIQDLSDFMKKYLLFHTNAESGKTHDLASDSHINISFLNSSGEWASVSGTARVITNRSLVEKHYGAHLKAWLGDLQDGVHDGGVDDPRIGIIRTKMITAHYGFPQKSRIDQIAEVAQGIATGKPAVVNKLREISEAEVRQWRSSH
ncbi:hypothetical protein NEMBOFW57_006220 [Staphylotrichum longicolle]|uniref:General stress protein FMN-binding split barrel domain-containing protein n=1 Tax=Staphylotrichum longicolle TaxID=669026 RepID=A0AAD4EY46_9PEZI|nr:hypothetical protein NEMBOFW57_006220 [Staphylotrichum longicolle]